MNKSLLALFPLILGILALGCRNQPKSAADAHIQVVMKKYTIEPAIIHVKSSQTTELDVTTPDVQHGFDVPALGIKEPVRPGQPIREFRFAEIPASRRHWFPCSRSRLLALRSH